MGDSRMSTAKGAGRGKGASSTDGEDDEVVVRIPILI